MWCAPGASMTSWNAVTSAGGSCCASRSTRRTAWIRSTRPPGSSSPPRRSSGSRKVTVIWPTSRPAWATTSSPTCPAWPGPRLTPSTSGEAAGWPAAHATDALRLNTMRATLGGQLRAAGQRGNCSAGQRLVDELAQLRADPVGAGREQLGEERDGQLLLRVDPERGAGGAAPRKLPSRAHHPGRGRVGDHGEPEAEADPVERELRVERPAERVQIEAAGKMVARHVADRAGAQQPGTIQLSRRAVRAVQQHLGEP